MSSLSPISAVSAAPAFQPLTSSGQSTGPQTGPSELKTTFQNAVASMFFGQMMKALRSGVGKPAYIHGGQAEEMFQSQMDQHVAENLAKSDGGPFIENLYQRFLVDHPDPGGKPPAELASFAQSVKSTPTMESAQQASWARPSTSGARNTTGTGVIPALNRK